MWPVLLQAVFPCLYSGPAMTGGQGAGSSCRSGGGLSFLPCAGGTCTAGFNGPGPMSTPGQATPPLKHKHQSTNNRLGTAVNKPNIKRSRRSLQSRLPSSSRFRPNRGQTNTAANCWRRHISITLAIAPPDRLSPIAVNQPTTASRRSLAVHRPHHGCASCPRVRDAPIPKYSRPVVLDSSSKRT